MEECLKHQCKWIRDVILTNDFKQLLKSVGIEIIEDETIHGGTGRRSGSEYRGLVKKTNIVKMFDLSAYPYVGAKNKEDEEKFFKGLYEKLIALFKNESTGYY